jgi:hypothetical protein
VKFISIKDELEARNLKATRINALHPDDEPYTILLNQYKGELEATPTFIGNSVKTHALATLKFTNFLQLANVKQHDVVVCPEYSCPWDSIEATIETNSLPFAGKLWVIGTESITPKDLKTFIAKNEKIEWIFDKELLEGNHQGIFFDPVCYFFKATRNNGTESNVCAIQFKNQHMSVHNDMYREEDYLIEGKSAYIFCNEGKTVNLLTMICSDSLKFKISDFNDADLDKLIVIHIQMNLLPRYPDFKRYRDSIFTGESDKVEVICLNWAKDSMVMGKKLAYSGTSYFLKPEKPILEDRRLNDNQTKGLFYCYWHDKRCHAFFFESEEYLIGFSTTKASQGLVESATLRRREGPVSQINYKWVDNAYSDANSNVDSFKAHCDNLACDLSPLDAISHIEKERIIRLSNGGNLKNKWFEVKSFDLFLITDSEIIHRLTFTDEIDETARAMKATYIMNFKELIIIFKNHKVNFPITLKRLTEDSKIHYNSEIDPFINVYSSTNLPIGTISYIGASVENRARRDYDILNQLHLAYLEDRRGREKPTIIVWYNDNGYKFHHIEDNQIDSDLDKSEISIIK